MTPPVEQNMQMTKISIDVISVPISDIYSKLVVEWLNDIGIHWSPSQSYGASPAIWDHTLLPACRQRWSRSLITSARQAGTRFTYPGRMEGWVVLGVGYFSRWFTWLQSADSHPSKY